MEKKISIIVSIVLVVVLGAVTIAVNLDSNNRDDLTGEEKNITITVFNKESENIYNENIKTDNNYLLEVLNETEELKVVIEDGPYGAYITSIMDISQGENYYWTYYIDDEYASVGVSNCEIKDGNNYSFKIEKYE